MMYVLDTHVVSELRKVRLGKADAHVTAWAESVDAAGLFVSAITIMELELGVLSVERKDAAQGATLRAWLQQHVLPEFAERVLPWMQAVARVADCEFILLAVPEVPEPAMYGAMAEAVDDLRQQAEANSQRYLTQLAERLTDLGLRVRPVVGGSRPATAILELAEQELVEQIARETRSSSAAAKARDRSSCSATSSVSR